MKAVVLCSGGMDSVTLAHDYASRGYALHLVSVHYGQRHSKELDFAVECAERLQAEHTFLPMGWLGSMLHGSALTSERVAVPEGHYAAPSMAQTVVANRNMILLAIAGGIAVAERADLVGTAVHAGDHAIYPDCRPEFIRAMRAALCVGTEGHAVPGFYGIDAPFVHRTKAEIATRGRALGVPYERTWSCYNGGDLHCGRCGTCVERIEALDAAGYDDRTPYLDRDFAKRALAERASAGGV